MKYLLSIIPFISYLYAATPQNVVDCNIIFEQRKAEILERIEKIDEQQQALQALQSANQAILDQREAALMEREKEVNSTMEAITLKESKLKRMMSENADTLKAIKNAKDNKLAETYTNMKDSKAAPIIEQLDNTQAATILFSLDSKVASKILSKMAPARAAELTTLLQKGPPFAPEASALNPTADKLITPALAPETIIPSIPGENTGGAI